MRNEKLNKQLYREGLQTASQNQHLSTVITRSWRDMQAFQPLKTQYLNVLSNTLTEIAYFNHCLQEVNIAVYYEIVQYVYE